MTKKELSQLYWIKKEIRRYERRLAELEELKRSIGSSFGGGGHGSGNSKVERIALEITDLEAILAAKKLERIHEQARLERYIERIDDAYIRLIFKLHYVDGLSWVKVARELKGTTADAARKAADRYIEKK